MDNYNASTFAERRIAPRLAIKIEVQYEYLNLSDEERVHSVGLSRNIGSGGIAIFVSREVETGSTLRMKLNLPNHLGTEKSRGDGEPYTRVELCGRVVWRMPLGDQRFLLGMQFLDLDQADAEILRDFLKHYQIQGAEIV
jgi:hypothetical protein